MASSTRLASRIEVSSPTMRPLAAAWREAPVARRDEHRRRRERLLHDGGEELPLALGPADVAARVGVAGAHVAQGVLAVEDLAALLEVDAGLLVVHVELHADVDAADAVDDGGEPAEADLDVAVDVQVGDLLDGLDQQVRAAEGEGGVDLVAAVARDRHVAVAGERDQRRLPAALGHVHEDDRVGAPARRVAGGVLLALGLGQPCAAVGPDEQVVVALALRGGGRRPGVVSTLVTVFQACTGV